MRSLLRIEPSYPDPIFLRPTPMDPGQSISGSMTPASLNTFLDAKYSEMAQDVIKRPGELMRRLENANPDAPLSPRLTLATVSAFFHENVDRPALEMSILGRWGSDFAHDYNDVISHNVIENHYPEQSTIEVSSLFKFSLDMVRAYWEEGLIQKNDDLLDVGTQLGFVPLIMRRHGVNVTALEPNIAILKSRVSWIEDYPDDPTKDIIPLTVQEYAEQHPAKKFAVVHVGNFWPKHNNSTDRLDPFNIDTMIKALSSLTAPAGKMLLGVSATNPEFVSGTSRLRLRPFLENHFAKVDYISAKKFRDFDEHFSVGGQMGIFKCTHPRPPITE